MLKSSLTTLLLATTLARAGESVPTGNVSTESERVKGVTSQENRYCFEALACAARTRSVLRRRCCRARTASLVAPALMPSARPAQFRVAQPRVTPPQPQEQIPPLSP